MGLLEFQEKSVNHIIDYYKTHSIYLLADETGLGKTHIASAVMQKLAEEKLAEVQKLAEGESDFRVVYIA